ncbi:MAG TPA: hypothetical protein VGH01_06875 [Jatrophihabitantaceae bacterium]
MTSAVLAVAAAVAAVWLIVTAKDTKHAQIGALLGFWSLLMAAFPALGSRGARPAGPVLTGTELDLRPAGVLERREDAQQRTAYERELMQLVRTEISSTLGPELANLRADVAALRGEILETVGGQIRLERIETTRMIGSDLEALQHELRQLRGDAAPVPDRFMDRPEPRGLANRLWEQPAQAAVAPSPAAPAASAPYVPAPAATAQPPTAPPPATVPPTAPPQDAMQPTEVVATEPSPEWSDWTVPAPIVAPIVEPVAESAAEPTVASPVELRIAAEVEATMASGPTSEAGRQQAEQAAADRDALGIAEDEEDEDDDDPFALLPRIPPYLNPEPGPHYPREEYSGGRRPEAGGRSSGGRHSGGDGQWAAESTQRGGRRRRSDASEDVLARILEREAPQY